jgi:RHH-type rel operon transcriptional repressor/antitoxin RelB
MLALRLPEDIESRLDKLAKATGRTKSFYAREAILEHLADLEDLYLAEKRLAKVRNGKRKTYSLNAVEQAPWQIEIDQAAKKELGDF